MNVRLYSRLVPGRTLLYTNIAPPVVCDGERLYLHPRGSVQEDIELEMKDFTLIWLDEDGAVT